MDRNDRSCPRRDLLADSSRIDVAGVRIDVGEFGRRAGSCDRLGGGHKTVGGGDDLVPATNSERSEREEECVAAAADANAVAAGAERGGVNKAYSGAV